MISNAKLSAELDLQMTDYNCRENSAIDLKDKFNDFTIL